MREERVFADEWLVKKFRLDSKPTFKKLQDRFYAVETAPRQNSLGIEKICSAAQEGKGLINVRQRILK